jgi:hypothetical protein
MWQAARHGKQRRTKTRNQEATQKETAEAPCVPASGAQRVHARHAEALITGFENRTARSDVQLCNRAPLSML